MRFFAIAALVSLAAALPAVVPAEQNTSVATRDDALGNSLAHDVVARQGGFIPYDRNAPWPEEANDEVSGGGTSAIFECRNIGGGNYRFSFTSFSPGGSLRYRVSVAGTVLLNEGIDPRRAKSFVVQRAGSQFNINIDAA